MFRDGRAPAYGAAHPPSTQLIWVIHFRNMSHHSFAFGNLGLTCLF
jgi:hypothetical protein